MRTPRAKGISLGSELPLHLPALLTHLAPLDKLLIGGVDAEWRAARVEGGLLSGGDDHIEERSPGEKSRRGMGARRLRKASQRVQSEGGSRSVAEREGAGGGIYTPLATDKETHALLDEAKRRVGEQEELLSRGSCLAQQRRERRRRVEVSVRVGSDRVVHDTFPHGGATGETVRARSSERRQQGAERRPQRGIAAAAGSVRLLLQGRNLCMSPDMCTHCMAFDTSSPKAEGSNGIDASTASCTTSASRQASLSANRSLST